MRPDYVHVGKEIYEIANIYAISERDSLTCHVVMN